MIWPCRPAQTPCQSCPRGQTFLPQTCTRITSNRQDFSIFDLVKHHKLSKVSKSVSNTNLIDQQPGKIIRIKPPTWQWPLTARAPPRPSGAQVSAQKWCQPCAPPANPGRRSGDPQSQSCRRAGEAGSALLWLPCRNRRTWSLAFWQVLVFSKRRCLLLDVGLQVLFADTSANVEGGWVRL